MTQSRSFKEYVRNNLDNQMWNAIGEYLASVEPSTLDLRLNKVRNIGEMELYDTELQFVDVSDLPGSAIEFDVVMDATIIVYDLRMQGYGYGTIAKKLDLKMETVKAHCRRYGLGGNAKDLPGGVNDDTRCKNCGAEITQNPKRKKKLFCCDTCRRKWWNTHMYMVERKAWYDFVCPNCGKTFRVYGNSHRKYCCLECYIEDRFGDNTL